ncbi:S-adenosyl-L-methionine-dependent methyltransferase [Podospora aff. communis PSN243]|uniref:S-adenosyl-L-methionine-dependent methyltransferase n=1 Tax=Podospora aff. communis PSN243 TaxID=3040156 RepID=A0AAV9GYX8_9PEZI|nr:S-adenosyl-L-methionine-dependent methyltransferase [Podospora aff. communis PSN243]
MIAYFCPIDERENDRLDMQSFVLSELLGGLHLSPFSNDRHVGKILDVCCGSGMWAIDMADRYPEHSVTGTDLAPIQPSWVPPNLRFELDDARAPWMFRREFDLIHTSSTIHAGCWGDFKTEAIQQAFDSLRPGGWLECQEFGSLVNCDDGSLPVDCHLAGWARAVNTAASRAGRPRDVAPQMFEWFKDVGFVDVREVRYKLPIGRWAKDPHLKVPGLGWFITLESGLDALSSRLFTCVLDMYREEIEVLHQKVRRDLKDPKIHAYSEIFVVYGRKPLDEEVADVSPPPPTQLLSPPASPPLSSQLFSSPAPDLHLTQLLSPPASPIATPMTGIVHHSPNGATKSIDDASTSKSSSSGNSSCSDTESTWLRQRQRALLEHIMRTLCLYLDSRILQHASAIGNGDPGPGSGPDDSSSGNAIPGSNTPNTSREQGGRDTRRGHNGCGEDDDGESGGDKRKGKSKMPMDTSEERRKFACPYYKRDPGKYGKWTSCPGPGWTQVHRIKSDHLYRRHALPPQCPRCWEPFGSDDALREHLREDTACVKQENQTVLAGFTKEQESLLQKRARKGKTEEEKWREMYQILFPDDDPKTMPSPYYEPTQLNAPSGAEGMASFAVFLRREMPALVRRELESMFENEFQALEESLRPQIQQLIIDLQPRLLRRFQESLSGEAGEPDLFPDQEGVQDEVLPGNQTAVDGVEASDPEEEALYQLEFDELVNEVGEMDNLNLPLGDEFAPEFDFDEILGTYFVDPSLDSAEHQD